MVSLTLKYLLLFDDFPKKINGLCGVDKPARLTIVLHNSTICQIRYKRTNSETVTLSSVEMRLVHET